MTSDNNLHPYLQPFKEVRWELMLKGIRIITPYGVSLIAEEDFLNFQQAYKEALFEYCRINNVRLGQITGTKETNKDGQKTRID